MSKTNKLSTNKIEKKALNVLESIIDEHSTMDYKFNSDDKEMSWDGYIWLNKEDNGIQSKKNTVSRIPVQIKGHIDKEQKFITKDHITYPVDIDDLELYGTEKGVLYFQIFINGEEKEVFYSSLYPSKVADYLNIAKLSGNKTSISISFEKLEKNPDKLFVVAKQFNETALKQGSAFTPLVEDRIRINEFNKIKQINFSVVGYVGILDVLKRLSIGDICLFGKTDENEKYYRPIEWKENAKYYSEKEVEQQISVDGTVYYEKYKVITGSDNSLIIFPSPNLQLNFSKGKFNFQLNSKLQELYNDAQFLLSLNAKGEFYLSNHKFSVKNLEINKALDDKLHFIQDLYEVLAYSGLYEIIQFCELSENEYKSLISLINIVKNSDGDYFKDIYSRYDWKIGEKYYPLLVIRENESIKLLSSVYSKDYGIFIYDFEKKEPEPKYRMPTFTYHSPELLSKLFYYDFENFKEQIETCDVNEKIKDDLNSCVLPLISTYDICGDKRFLELAEVLLHRMSSFGETPLMLLNKLQIVKRYRSLAKTEIDQLDHLDSEDHQILFGKYVLLDDYYQADNYFSMFTDQEKEAYKKYPIFTLFEKINHSKYAHIEE